MVVCPPRSHYNLRFTLCSSRRGAWRDVWPEVTCPGPPRFPGQEALRRPCASPGRAPPRARHSGRDPSTSRGLSVSPLVSRMRTHLSPSYDEPLRAQMTHNTLVFKQEHSRGRRCRKRRDLCFTCMCVWYVCVVCVYVWYV